MFRRKLQLSVISILVVLLVLFSSYGGLVGSVTRPKKSDALATGAIVTIICTVVPIIYEMVPNVAKTFTRANAEAIEEKLVELAKADNNYDALMQQATNAMPNYPSPVPFIPTALSGLTLNEMYNAVVAVLYPSNNNETYGFTMPAKLDGFTDYKLFGIVDSYYFFYSYNPNYILDINNVEYDSINKILKYNSIAGNDVISMYNYTGAVTYSEPAFVLYECQLNNTTTYSTYGYPYAYFSGGDEFYRYVKIVPHYYNLMPELLNIADNNNTVTNLTTYPMPAQIPEDTMTAITNGDTDIPINNFANISYDNSTNTWTFDPDAYVLIDKTATPTVTPTPSPSPTVAPDPTPTATDGDGNTNGWLQAIYKKLVAMDATLKTYWAQLFKDLNIVNDHLKNMIANGGTGTDADGDGADDGIVSNITDFLKAFLEFLRSALVPTLSLNLDDLNKMPDNFSKKFPFSLPSDISKIIGVIKSDPITPVFDFNIPLSFVGFSDLNYHFDLNTFNDAATIFRTGLLIVFCLGLGWKTYDLLSGGG